MIKKLIYSSFIYIIILAIAGCSSQPENDVKTDVVIYGGTSAAVIAAVELAQSDKSVIIVCPETHLGGLTTSGLGFTDTGNKNIIGGLSKAFYQRLYSHYQREDAWTWQDKSEYGNKGQSTPAMDGEAKSMWIFEPHVAEKIFEDFIAENNISVYRDQWLDREKGVALEDGKILQITTLSGTTFQADIFIDATYEGDLMAAAGVSYHVGRESNEKYGETWNGVQKGVFHHGHNFGSLNISPYIEPGNPSSGILPRISDEDPGKNGEGDNRIQAYCFRMCLTKHPENKKSIQKPAGYDSTQYALLLRIFDAGWNEVFHKFDPIPNAKTDVNNHGPFSFDNIGMNYDYPEADYARRAEIIEEHRQYQQGLLYFLAHDPRVPDSIRTEMNQWGLAGDEFMDNDNWPYQIYVREARRMQGEFVMTEHEVLGLKPVPHSIGMGSYTMDSHNTQRYITPEGFVQNEGDVGVHPHKPYQIEMGTVIPRQEECNNLLVPVAVSSSHIAFGSIRMEPVFMILGQSAGIIASTALDEGKDIHQVTYDDIHEKLKEAGQILDY